MPYETRAIGTIDDRYDMVMFRRFMVRTAARLARRRGLALVTGDSLGQVASQTLHNLAAISPDVSLPILRPLVGLDNCARSRPGASEPAFSTPRSSPTATVAPSVRPGPS
ncbi:MAG: hypothetical protein IPG61_20295 [bacterium]|nr:hypothetical protein [bacterium]